MVATQKLAKDDLVSRVAAKFFGPGQPKLLASFGYGRQNREVRSLLKACRETDDGHASLRWKPPRHRSSHVAMGIAGHRRNGLEPRAGARVASLFPPDLFHPLLAFLQRHL
jgi:hypothetical protein